MRIIFDVIAAAAIAVLSGMGIGSAGLLVIWLTSTSSISQLSAQGLNLYFFLFSSGASLLLHIHKRKIFWGVVAFMTFFGILGSMIGTSVSARLHPDLLRRLFGAMLIFGGSTSLFGLLGLKKTKITLK